MLLIKMKKGAREESVTRVTHKIAELQSGSWLNSKTGTRSIVLLESGRQEINPEDFMILPEVEKVIRLKESCILSLKAFQEEKTIVKIGNIEIGGDKMIIAAGPCAVESREQILLCAEKVKELGGQILRGGAFKPRTSPFTFQGLKEEGLKLLAEARDKTGLLIATEIVSSEDIELFKQYVDVLQVGARNMQNYRLLEVIGNTEIPVFLKRGCAATIEEWLTAADYLLKGGNTNVILCERGIRTFSSSLGDLSTRFTTDVAAIAIVKEFSHLPVISDPSHAAGHFKLVPTLAKAVIAAGVDGLLVEVHPEPQKASSDNLQQLTFSDFERLMKEIAAESGKKMQ